jgi:Tfp pilus assembly protein PilF
MSYFKYGDKANARKHLSEALQLRPNFPGVDESLAILQKL